MKIQDKLEVALPFFGGFYNSELSDLMDREIEQEAEFNGKEVEYLYGIYNFKKAMEAISRGWVQAFSQETGIPLEYGEVSSPRNTTSLRIGFLPLFQ